MSMRGLGASSGISSTNGLEGSVNSGPSDNDAAAVVGLDACWAMAA